MRITFGLLILFGLAFTLVGGGSRKVGTHQAAPLNSDPEGDPRYTPSIVDVSFIDSSHAWAVGRSGNTLYRIDNGVAVRKQATDFKGRTFLSFVNRSTGFAFVYSLGEARLWRTSDGGESWQKVNDSAQTFSGYQFTAVSRLQFIDERHGWLSDAFTVWRTEDGGARWVEVFSTSDHEEINALNQVAFNGSERAMIATRAGIYLTLDGGKDWKLTNRNKELAAVYTLDERTSWAWGAWLERTDDGGNTWRKLYELNGRIEIISTHFINKNEGWAAGLEVPESFASRVRNPDAPKSNGILLHTKDGGKNWEHAPVPADILFQRVTFFDSKQGWLVGMTRLYRTSDGVHWTIALDAPGDQ